MGYRPYGGLLAVHILFCVLLCQLPSIGSYYADPGAAYWSGSWTRNSYSGLDPSDPDELARAGATTPPTPGPELSTMSAADRKLLESENQTSLADEDVNKVLFLEYGNYTTQTFHYANAQDLGKRQKVDYCYDDYMRCITSITIPTGVCAWHNGIRFRGVMMRPSYCDVYFENCKVGWRHWRVVGYGYCIFRDRLEVQNIADNRRMNAWLSHYYRRNVQE